MIIKESCYTEFTSHLEDLICPAIPQSGISLTLNIFLYEKAQDRGHRARSSHLLLPTGQKGPGSIRPMAGQLLQLYPLALPQRRDGLLSGDRLLAKMNSVKVDRKVDLYPPINKPQLLFVKNIHPHDPTNPAFAVCRLSALHNQLPSTTLIRIRRRSPTPNLPDCRRYDSQPARIRARGKL